MKRLWVAAGLLCAVAVLCIGTMYLQRRTVQRLSDSLDAAVSAVTAGAADAAEQTAAFAAAARSAGEAVAFMARHADSCPLRESAALLPTLLQTGQTEAFYAEAARCRFFLSELRDAEKPLLGNIF